MKLGSYELWCFTASSYDQEKNTGCIMISGPLPEKPVIIIGVATWSLPIMIGLDETTQILKRLDLEASAMDPESSSTAPQS